MTDALSSRTPADATAHAYFIENQRGQRLLCLARSTTWPAPLGVVVLPPGYERRPHHYAVFADYLVRHGFDVVRFDFANHIGDSDGDVIDFTMSSMSSDIEAVLLDTATRYQGLPLAVVAASLASRAAIRAASRTTPAASVEAIGLILPVVDTEFTTTQAIGKNVIDEWRSGKQTDATARCRVLSHDVTYEFSRDAIVNDWAGTAACSRELDLLGTGVLAIAAAQDDWTSVDDIAQTLGNRPEREIVVLEAASHELSLNAPVVRQLMEELTTWLWRRLGHSAGAVEHPSFQSVVELTNRERAWKSDHYASLLEQPTYD